MPWDPSDQGGFQKDHRNLTEVIKQTTSGFGKAGGPGNRQWLWILIILIGFYGIYSSAYTIKPGHRGVVLRFGEYSKTVTPGLNFKLPFGFDRVYKVHVDKVDTENFGFTSTKAGIRTRFEKDARNTRESLMLTGDLNVIDVEWIVQFKRQDPRKYLFNINDPVQTIRDISQSVIRRIVGNRSFDYVLQNREVVSRLFKDELQVILDEYESGVRIVDVRLKNVVPPEAVRGAFNEVNEAQQEKERLINQAQEIYNNQIPKARGQAEQVVNEAQGYALERVNNARGETARFVDVYNQYRNARTVTKRRMYLETLQDIIPNAKEVYIIDSDQKTILPMLDLDKLKAEGGR